MSLNIEAGLPTQIRNLEKRLKEMDASKIKPSVLKEITDTINNLKNLLKEKLEKKEQRKKDKEQKAQEVEKEAISVPNAADVGAVSQNVPAPAAAPGAPAATPDNQKVSCPLCGGLEFNDNASYQQHMAYTHASDIMPTSPGQKQDKLVATIEPEEAALNKKIQFKLDQIVKPTRGSESKGKIMRHDGPDDLAFVMWEEGALKDRDGFGGYYPQDLSAVEEDKPIEAALPMEKPVCADCVSMKQKHGDLKTNYEALLKDLKEERDIHYTQGNNSWVARLDQKIQDLENSIKEKFGIEPEACTACGQKKQSGAQNAEDLTILDHTPPRANSGPDAGGKDTHDEFQDEWAMPAGIELQSKLPKAQQKELDSLVQKAVYGYQINIMDMSKVYQAGEAAFIAGQDVTAAIHAFLDSMVAAGKAMKTADLKAPVTEPTKLLVFKREFLATPLKEQEKHGGYEISQNGKKLFKINSSNSQPMSKEQIEFCAQIELTRGLKQAKLTEKIAFLNAGTKVYILAQDRAGKRVKFACMEQGLRGWAPITKFAFQAKEGEMRKHRDHIDNTFGHNGKEMLVDCPNGSGNMVWLPINELLPIQAPPATPESLNPDLGLESAKKELPTKNCIHCGNKFSYDPRYQTEESAKKCQDCFGKENDKWQIEQKKRKEYEKSKKHPKNIDPTFPSGSRFDIEDPLAVPRNINDLEAEKECPDCHGNFEGAEGATCPTCGRFAIQKEALRPALAPQILNRRQEVNASGREWAVRLDGRVLDGRYLTEAEAIKALDSIPSIAFDNGEVVYSLDVPDTEQEQHYKNSSLNKVATVVHRTDGWHVLSEKGKNLGGPYKSKAEAVKRLRQVEYFKHHGSMRPFSKQVYAEVLTDPYQTLSTHITEMRTRMDQVNERLQNAPAVKTAKEDAAPEMDLAALFADLTQGIDLLETKLGGDDIEPELHKGVEELENKLWTLEEKLGLTPKLSEHEKAEPEHKKIVEDIDKEAGRRSYCEKCDKQISHGRFCDKCKEKEVKKEAAVVTDETIEETTNDPSLANPSLTPIPPPTPGFQNIQPTDNDNLEISVPMPTSPPPPGQKWQFNSVDKVYVLMPDTTNPAKLV